MSKLLDKLDKAAQGETKPFGFATSVSKSALPQILTIARTRLDVEAKTVPKIDSDAVLLLVDDTSKAIDYVKKINKEQLPAIWGIEAAAIRKKEADQLVKIGCDFIVLKLTSPAPALSSDETLAKVVQLSPHIDDSMIRAISLLPVDAAMVQEDAPVSAVTVESLMQYSRIAAMLQQPLLLSVSLKLEKDGLETLRDIGINGLVFDWSGASSNKKLADLKEAIAGLPEPKKKKMKHENATLPSTSSTSYDEDDDY